MYLNTQEVPRWGPGWSCEGSCRAERAACGCCTSGKRDLSQDLLPSALGCIPKRNTIRKRTKILSIIVRRKIRLFLIAAIIVNTCLLLSRLYGGCWVQSPLLNAFNFLSLSFVSHFYLWSFGGRGSFLLSWLICLWRYSNCCLQTAMQATSRVRWKHREQHHWPHAGHWALWHFQQCVWNQVSRESCARPGQLHCRARRAHAGLTPGPGLPGNRRPGPSLPHPNHLGFR